MPKYLYKANYTEEGAVGLQKEGGTGRRAAVKKAVESMGGKLEVFYFAFGETDVYGIAEMPDNVSAAAFAMLVGFGGGATVNTTVLITPEEADEIVKKTADYRPPGK
ncbi:GYD domain-containing protein [Chloroflexota bacterium]